MGLARDAMTARGTGGRVHAEGCAPEGIDGKRYTSCGRTLDPERLARCVRTVVEKHGGWTAAGDAAGGFTVLDALVADLAA